MKQDWQSKILVFGFLLVLALPMARMFIENKKGILTSENRNSAPFPSFNLNGQSGPYEAVIQYVKDINAYCSDHIGFRSDFLAIYRYYKLSLFSVSPYPDEVVLGTNHWYFLGNSHGDVIKESKGIIYYSESELNFIEKNINAIGEDCLKRGIKVYVAIAPNKLSVYGQYLPIIKSEHPTKLDQIIKGMKNYNINIIDLKRDFPNYNNRRLFYMHGTHWNSFGAFLGYRTLMEYIVRDFPELKMLSLDDFKLNTVISGSDDLTGMLSLKIPEEDVVMEPKYNCNVIQQDDKLTIPDYFSGNPENYEIRYINSTRPHKVLIFRDSFFIAMMPFIKDSFGESVFIWTPYDRRVLEIEKPDLVICEMVERNIEDFGNIHL